MQSIKIKNAKSSFNHNKIKSWDNVEEFKEEVMPYLKLDVLALKELFENFNDLIYEKFQTNITKYVTASHMGYEIWRSMLEDIIEIPDILEKYEFIMEKEFKSKHYDDIVNKKMTYDELKKTEEFIFNSDVSSLYPASMRK